MKGLLFASFGTSYEEARVKHIDAVAQHVHEALPGYRLAQAYTSNMVRRILAKREIEVPDVAGALQRFADEGITQVLIVPGHLLLGTEFDKLCEQAQSCEGLFESLVIADPLLASTADVQDMAEVVAARYPEKADTAFVLMGHGTPQFANVVYAALEYHFRTIGRKDIFVGTVEAFPELGTVMQMVGQGDFRRVELAPLMLVAGDHAVNDMAGDVPESWASQFQAAGYEVESHVVGLGEIPQVQDLYLKHALRALAREESAEAAGGKERTHS